MRTPRLMKFAPIFFVLVLCTLVRAQGGDYKRLGTFSSGNTDYSVATYTEGEDRIGVMGIHAGDAKIAVAFAGSEWPQFVDLWHRARQSHAASWEFIGTFKEVGTKDPTLLIMVGGPDVEIILMDSTGTLTFVVPKGEYDRFDGNVMQVAEYVRGH
jgi:hypothetical protein